MIFRRSRDVPALDEYEAYRPFLRQDFEYRCAYCLRHEFFFGGGEAGEIDPHRPRHLFPDLTVDYNNLYWSYRKCNAIKGGKWPSTEQMGRDLRFLNPCAEDHDNHWRTQPDGTLGPLTSVGQYTIRQMRLDRATLSQFRQFLYRLQERTRTIEATLMASDLSPEMRAGLRTELEAAPLLLDPPVFTL